MQTNHLSSSDFRNISLNFTWNSILIFSEFGTISKWLKLESTINMQQSTLLSSDQLTHKNISLVSNPTNIQTDPPQTSKSNQ